MSKNYSMQNEANDTKINYALKLFESFLMQPSVQGVKGFLIFFAIVLIIKTIIFLIYTEDKLVMQVEDLYLSSIGFCMTFVIKFLENFSYRKK